MFSTTEKSAFTSGGYSKHGPLFIFMFCSHGRLFKRAFNQDRAVKRVYTVTGIAKNNPIQFNGNYITNKWFGCGFTLGSSNGRHLHELADKQSPEKNKKIHLRYVDDLFLAFDNPNDVKSM